MSPSSGPTCASRPRTAATLLLLLLLGAVSAVEPWPAASAAAPPPPSVSLGFGPSALFPASGGAPVYTVGETVWVESNYTYPVPLTIAPGGTSSSVVAQTTLEPQTVVPVYTFTASDPEGVWNITLQTNQAKQGVPVRLVDLADHRPLLSGGLQYGLDGGNLSISAQADLAGFYDTEACAVGSAPQPVNVALPRQMGDYGNVTLGPGAPLVVSTLGVINESVSFWLELYQPYSLDSGGTNLVAQDLLAARSTPVDITTNGPTNATLAWDAPLRAGRYDLRSYFENSTAIEVFQSRVLLLNSSVWVPLSSVCPPQQESSGISYSARLTGGQASWPKELYYMYRTLGVEAVASFPVDPDLSSVNFVASPWNKPVEDARVTVASFQGVAETSQAGGSLFILASNYPAQVTYSLDIGGAPDLSQRSATIDGPYSAQTIQVSLAELTVHLASDQAAPIDLAVTGPQGLDITRDPVGPNRTVSLYLPTGSYALTASQQGQSEGGQVSLTDGTAASTTLSFNGFTTVELVLAATAAIAVAANVLLWIFRSRRGGLVRRPRAKEP